MVVQYLLLLILRPGTNLAVVRHLKLRQATGGWSIISPIERYSGIIYIHVFSIRKESVAIIDALILFILYFSYIAVASAHSHAFLALKDLTLPNYKNLSKFKSFADDKYMAVQMVRFVVGAALWGKRKKCYLRFLAHLSTTCSRGAVKVVLCPMSFVRRPSCVVRRASSTISLNIFSFQTAGPIWTKLGRNVFRRS